MIVRIVTLGLALLIAAGCRETSKESAPPAPAVAEPKAPAVASPPAERTGLHLMAPADDSQPPTVVAGPSPVPAGASGLWDEPEDTTVYAVVVNHEEQYSLWPADREVPLGWRAVGKTGTKEECLAYIEEVWTDMRPLSLRKKMEEMEQQPAAE